MAAATTSTPPPTSSPTWRSNLDPATTAATYSMYESYGYDAAGQQRSHTIVDGTTPVTSTLDAEGRTTSIAEGLGGSGPYTGTYGYNQNDLPISLTLPGGVHTAWGYDPNSQLISTTATGPSQTPATTTLTSSYAYGYNATGWLTSTTTLSGTDTITHDAQGRLTADCGPQVVAKGGCARWSYDANGNLLTAIDDSGVTDVYSYTAGQPNEQTAGGSSTSPATATIALAYDAHGDTTSISNPVALTDPTSAGYKKYALNESFGYDAAARPITVTRLVGNKDGTTTPLTATLQYNADGLRSDYLLTPVPGEGSLVDTRFAYRDGVLASATVTDNTGALLYKNTFIYGPSGEPYELIRTDPKGTRRFWYVLDGLGSVVALTDQNGKVVDRYAYDSWGEPTGDDRTNETVPQQLRYRGYYYDEALTYYWVTTRYYDPEGMHWFQPDPSDQDGVRTYAYVSDDPIDWYDPSGLCKLVVHFEAAFPSLGHPTPIGKHPYITLQDNPLVENPFGTRDIPTPIVKGPAPYSPRVGDFYIFEGAQVNNYIKTDPGEPRIVKRSERRAASDGGNGSVISLKPSILVANNAIPCKCYLDRFVQLGNAIDSYNIPYEPLYENSNAFVFTILLHSGVRNLPAGPGEGGVPQDAPGWGLDLFGSYWVLQQRYLHSR